MAMVFLVTFLGKAPLEGLARAFLGCSVVVVSTDSGLVASGVAVI